VGNFYSNVTCLDVGLDAVRAVLRGPAYALVRGPDVVVFAQDDETGAGPTGAPLSAALGCVAVAAAVHDDDLLFWEVHRNGVIAASGAVPPPDEYFGGLDLDDLIGDGDPAEGGGDVDDPGPGEVEPGPAGAAGDLARAAAALVEAVGRGDIATLLAVLEDDYVFATDRHRAFVDALGLPVAAVGWGFSYLRDDAAAPVRGEVVALNHE
jgi:hypothetical protein